MTDSGPLNIPSVLLGTHRTLQDPSGPLRALWALHDPILQFYFNMLKDNICCRKMLVFYLNAFSSLINISSYIALRNKIKDILRIYIDRTVKNKWNFYSTCLGNREINNLTLSPSFWNALYSQSSSSEYEVDLHMYHMCTSWSWGTVSCQSSSDFHSVNI